MCKKTITVNDLREEINRLFLLPDAPPSSPQGRVALSDLLEWVLKSTGNYRGYAEDGEDPTRRHYI